MELQSEVNELKEALACASQSSKDAVVPIHPVLRTSNLPPGGQQACTCTPFLTDKVIGDIVTELFRVYLARCHPYPPFAICRSTETVHDTCPLLFWVCCTLASSSGLRL